MFPKDTMTPLDTCHFGTAVSKDGRRILLHIENESVQVGIALLPEEVDTLVLHLQRAKERVLDLAALASVYGEPVTVQELQAILTKA